jgi:hypothetical protein
MPDWGERMRKRQIRRPASSRLRYFPLAASPASLALNALLYRITSLIFPLLM